MTKENILKMEAGRVLDNEIAIGIFKNGSYAFSESGELWTADFKLAPFYSNDISAAWEVVEEHYGDVVVQRSIDGEYYATFYKPYNSPTNSGWCKTAPEAICKAALLAILESSHA